MDSRTKKRAQFLIDVAYIAVVALLVYLAFKYVAKWVLPFILAFCIVTAIHPIINRIVRLLKIKREIVSFLVMLFVYAIVGTLLFLLIINVVFAIRDALTLLPGYYESSIAPALSKLNNSFNEFIISLPDQWRVQAEGFQLDFSTAIRTFLSNFSQIGISFVSTLTGSVPSFLIAFLFTIMLSFFISMRYDKLLLFIKTQMPPRSIRIARDIRLILIDTVFNYLRAVFTLMVITASELTIGLLFLGQRNAIPIAAVIAVFDALPFFGTGAVVIPWTLIEFASGNYTFASGLLILYAIVSIIRTIIEPKIVGDRLGLNPIVSLCSIYLGFKVFGVLGMIIMPVITQIALALHKKGSIRLFREITPEEE